MRFVRRYRTMAELPPPSLELQSDADFIHRIDQLMRPTLEARGIAYSSAVEPPDLAVRADGGMLEQVRINLLHNGMDRARPPRPTRPRLPRAPRGRIYTIDPLPGLKLTVARVGLAAAAILIPLLGWRR